MTISAGNGPHIQSPSNPLGPLGTTSANQNPDSAPSLFLHGTGGALDPRAAYTYGGAAGENKCYGWAGGGFGLQCIDQVPSAISAVNIAASQSPGAGAITLVSTSGAGITVGVSIQRGDTLATVTGLLAIDGAMGAVAFSQSGNVNIWDPTKAISRAVRITSGGNDSAITFTVTGYDLYGFPMSEAITGANAGIATGKKAFKYISGVTHTGSVATTITIGTSDIIGLPIRADRFAYCGIFLGNTLITASTGFTAAVTTSPATTTTGDIRGTYALQTPSDGTERLQLFVTPSVANLGAVSATQTYTTGLLGVAQNLATTNG